MSPAADHARRHRSAGAGVVAVAALLVAACGKDKDDGPVSVPVPAASSAADRLSTGIGTGRAIDAEAAPSAARWLRAIVIDDRRAAFVGELAGEPIALSTEDAGRNWRAVRAEQSAWAAWGVAADTTLLLASGTRGARVGGARGVIDSLRVAFAAPDAKALGPAATLLPAEGSRQRPRIVAESLQPAAVSRDVAAFVIEDAPGRAAIHYAGAPGVTVGPPVRLPAGERPGATPLGRPPMLLSLRGREVVARRVPSPDAPLDAAVTIPGVVATPALTTELSRPPACEAGPWGFARITQGTKRAVLAVSPERALSVKLPDEPAAAAAARGSSPTAASASSSSVPAFGCGADRFAVETRDKGGASLVTTCTLEGACMAPEASPFRAWPEPHSRVVLLTTTATSTLALMSAQAGERWGVYLTQSNDAGRGYELSRVVGEGSGDRGRLEIGGLISLGSRALLLVAADVVGTSRRGWYVLASDDGGATWTPP